MSVLPILSLEFREDLDAALRLDAAAAKPTLEALAFEIERAVSGRDVLAIWRHARELAADGLQGHVSDAAEAAESRAASYLVARLPSGVAGALAAEVGFNWAAFQAHLGALGIEARRPALAVVAQHAGEAARWFAARLSAPLKGGE